MALNLSLNLAAILVATCILSCNSAPKSIQGVHQFPELEILGTIGNKTFYSTADQDFVVNFFGAREVCQGSALHFAILHSDAEFDFLRQNLHVSRKLWIDAILKGMNGFAQFPYMSGFENGDGTTFNTKNAMISTYDHLPCLFFSADDHIFTDMCLAGRRGVLCHQFTN
ncbi:uncharacterized protein LOC110861421 [Folsomia candida]|uniref:uncharacterized protein LOC110861421 n=1 Tax=Folsomia candida TaxID=158441 RepID=UPI000B8EFA2A|nr:uncharacterized protein LOC110861421 [Folsomia candida]